MKPFHNPCIFFLNVLLQKLFTGRIFWEHRMVLWHHCENLLLEPLFFTVYVVFLTCMYYRRYCKVSILGLCFRIKGWWVFQHYVSTFLSGVMLTWYDKLNSLTLWHITTLHLWIFGTLIKSILICIRFIRLIYFDYMLKNKCF